VQEQNFYGVLVQKSGEGGEKKKIVQKISSSVFRKVEEYNSDGSSDKEDE
jgi:hypothetical protein